MPTAVTLVPSEIVQKWQEIVNIITEIMHVPSALVMKVEPPSIKVFVSSKSNNNPYERDELASRIRGQKYTSFRQHHARIFNRPTRQKFPSYKGE